MCMKHVTLFVLVTLSVASAPAWSADNDVDALLDQASKAFGAGRHEVALKLADQAIQADPNELKSYVVRGMMLESVTRFEPAIRDYSRAIELDPGAADVYDRRGGAHFKRGDIDASIRDFDKAIALAPARAPYHWQRGISYYYADRFEDGRKQFELHQSVNPNDVENAVWHFLCAARSIGVEKARAVILPIRGDRRVPMMEVYALFKGTGTIDQVMAAARAGDPPPEIARRQLFYAHLYLGLYHEATGNTRRAREHITRAARDYADRHYMGDVARVHLQQLDKVRPKESTDPDSRR